MNYIHVDSSCEGDFFFCKSGRNFYLSGDRVIVNYIRDGFLIHRLCGGESWWCLPLLLLGFEERVWSPSPSPWGDNYGEEESRMSLDGSHLVCTFHCINSSALCLAEKTWEKMEKKQKKMICNHQVVLCCTMTLFLKMSFQWFMPICLWKNPNSWWWWWCQIGSTGRVREPFGACQTTRRFCFCLFVLFLCAGKNKNVQLTLFVFWYCFETEGLVPVVDVAFYQTDIKKIK